MLYNGSDVIRDVEWVIFDEIHYINDADVRKRIHYVYLKMDSKIDNDALLPFHLFFFKNLEKVNLKLIY